MIPQLHPESRYAVHLRSPSASGGKDWIGSITTANEIHTYWGKTASVNQHSSRTGTIRELDHIITKKIAKGYREVDRFHRETGWLSQKSGVGEQPYSSTEPVIPVKPVNLTVNTSQTLCWDF